jgi:hypothetical protein
MKERAGWIALVIAVAAVVVLYLIPGDQKTKLVLAAGYAAVLLVFFYGLMVLILMATGSINLSELLEDDTGGASMSRLQLLVFTFVIALSFFALVATKGQFPDVPANVLALLGISATTYGVSKGISVSAPPTPSATPSTPPATTPGGPATPTTPASAPKTSTP